MVYMRVGHTNDNDEDLLRFNSMSACTHYMNDMGIDDEFMIMSEVLLPDEYTLPEGYEE